MGNPLPSTIAFEHFIHLHFVLASGFIHLSYPLLNLYLTQITYTEFCFRHPSEKSTQISTCLLLSLPQQSLRPKTSQFQDRPCFRIKIRIWRTPSGRSSVFQTSMAQSSWKIPATSSSTPTDVVQLTAPSSMNKSNPANAPFATSLKRCGGL